MSEITIYAAKQLDGYTYALEPRSKATIVDQLPKEQVPASCVFISYDDIYTIKTDFEFLHGSIWKHIAELLTGLPAEKLQELGKVVFVDPRTLETVFELSEQYV